MISSLGWAFSDMADAVVVGQRLGATGLAAISLILPVYMFNCMMAHGLGLGGSVHFSNLLSQGKDEEAKAHFSSIVALAIVCSMFTAIAGFLLMDPFLLAVLGVREEAGDLFFATKDYLGILILSTPLFYFSNILNYYLRNDSRQGWAGFGSVLGNISDIALNIILVIGLGLGTRGAALSTSIGQVIAISVYIPGIIKSEHLKISIPKKQEIKKALRSMYSGFAISVQYCYQMIFFLICNNVLIRVGGESGVAIFDLLQNISYLILYLYEGTARAMQPLVSTYYGERNLSGRKNALKLGFASGILVGSLFIAGVVLFPGSFCILFGITESGLQMAAIEALRIYSLGAFFAGISILICNYYQSCEHLKAPFLIETMRGAAVLIPCTLVFSRLGIDKFWWLFPVTEIATLVFFFIWRKVSHAKIKEGNPDRVFQYTISGNSKDLMEVCEKIEEFCIKWKAGAKQRYFIVMTVEELGMAILLHGIKKDASGYIQITVIASEDGKFRLHLRDNALKFNPFEMETNRATNDEDVNLDSIGILVLKEKVEDFYYQRYQGFNSLVLTI